MSIEQDAIVEITVILLWSFRITTAKESGHKQVEEHEIYPQIILWYECSLDIMEVCGCKQFYHSMDSSR